MNRYTQTSFIALIFLSVYLIGTITLHVINQPHDADVKTAADLKTLDREILYYQQVHLKLPATLDQLGATGLNKRLKNYEYVPTSGASSATTATTGQPSFSLCGTFQTSTLVKSDQTQPVYFFEPKTHGKGHQCFSDSVLTAP